MSSSSVQGLVTSSSSPVCIIIWKAPLSPACTRSPFCRRTILPFIPQRVLFNENYSIIKWEMRKFRWKDELRRFLFCPLFHITQGSVIILLFLLFCRPVNQPGRIRSWVGRRIYTEGVTVQIIVILQNTLITHPFSRFTLQSCHVEGVLPVKSKRRRVNEWMTWVGEDL